MTSPHPSFVKTKLDKLNWMLESPDVKIPDFRRTVNASFGNLVWLRKALKNHPNEELRSLVSLSSSELLGNA